MTLSQMNCVLQLVGVDQGDANGPELVTTSDDESKDK